eukprot:Rmarinus@m.3532
MNRFNTLRLLITRCNGWSSRENSLPYNLRKHTWLLSPPLSRFAFTFVGIPLAISISACACEQSGEDICRLVHQHGTEPHSSLTPTIRRLIQEQPELVDKRHPMGWAPLHVAVILQDTEAVKMLLHGGADPNIADRYSARGLEMQARRQNEFHGGLPSTASTQGFTPLHYAALTANPEIVRALLEAGADPRIRDARSRTPLMISDLSQSASGRQEPGDKPVRKLLNDAMLRKEEEDLEEKRRQRCEYPLERRLHEDIVGQNGPIQAVASAIRRKENGWHDDSKPLVFLFLGSSGVGKTQLAKRVAAYVHGDKNEGKGASAEGSLPRKGFIRCDMSEYQQKHEVSKFIGAPPGYVGYTEGGQLTAKLAECPNAVVLLDEIEKAHEDILTIMLQLFDEGRLTDGQGNTIDCRGAVFIMTSNLGADEIAEYGARLRAKQMQLQHHPQQELPHSTTQQGADSQTPVAKVGTDGSSDTQSSSLNGSRLGEENSEEVSWDEVTDDFKERVLRPILKAHFRRDEFLGRIDEVMYFLPFSQEELRQLVSIELEQWKKQALERHNITLEWTEDVLVALVADYNVHYGARSIKHAVNKRVINNLAAAHEKGNIKSTSTVHLYVGPRGVIAFTAENKQSNCPPTSERIDSVKSEQGSRNSTSQEPSPS